MEVGFSESTRMRGASAGEVAEVAQALQCPPAFPPPDLVGAGSRGGGSCDAPKCCGEFTPSACHYPPLGRSGWAGVGDWPAAGGALPSEALRWASS